MSFDWKAPTTMLLGRWQPWHAGHRALFERAIAKTGQVAIMVRDCEGWNDSNPFGMEEVADKIHEDLHEQYAGQYVILFVPNITNITYGRAVGYTIEQEVFDEDIHAISATEIRKKMGLK
jgi:nicotinamide mononucleotide adenylyltransferase